MKTTLRYGGRRMLTVQRETQLVALAQGGDERAMRNLLEAYEPLIESIARRYSLHGPGHEDTVQEARMGMIHAVRKFDAAKGFRLSTYSRWWIRAHVLDWMLANRTSMKIATTATHKRLFNHLASAKRRLGITSDRSSHAELRDLAEQLGARVEEVETMEACLAPNAVVSLHARAGVDGDGISLIERIADERADPALHDEQIDDGRRMKAVSAAMERLDDRSRDVIASRFLADEALTLEDLGNRYGVTRERIRQIEVKALNDLRGMLPNRLSSHFGLRRAAAA